MAIKKSNPKREEAVKAICNLDSMKHYSDWNGCHLSEELLKDMLESATDELKREGLGKRVTIDDFQTARSRIYADGYHGPYNDDDFAAMHGRRMSMKKAKVIVRGALDAPCGKTEFVHPEYETLRWNKKEDREFDSEQDDVDDFENNVEQDNAEIDTCDVKKEYFNFVREIYGHYDI